MTYEQLHIAFFTQRFGVTSVDVAEVLGFAHEYGLLLNTANPVAKNNRLFQFTKVFWDAMPQKYKDMDADAFSAMVHMKLGGPDRAKG